MKNKINKIVIGIVIVCVIISFFKPFFSVVALNIIIVLAVINTIIEQFEKDKRLNDLENEIKELKTNERNHI